MPVNALLRIVGALTLGGFLLTAFTPLANVIARRLAPGWETAPADAIVVLGAGLMPEGELSRPSLKRAVRGIELYHVGYAPLLVFLGPKDDPDYPSEAEIRRRLARTMQVHPADVLVEDRALTTREEAAVLAGRLEGRGVARILLVTESQHLIRARALFENAGFEVLAAPADDYSIQPDGPSGRLILMKRVLEEQAARLYYRMAGYL